MLLLNHGGEAIHETHRHHRPHRGGEDHRAPGSGGADAHIIDADAVYHALESSATLRAELTARFGPSILDGRPSTTRPWAGWYSAIRRPWPT